jgi:hypothetical protein
MGAILTAIGAVLGSLATPIKDWFTYRTKAAQSRQDLELAKIEAEKQAIVSTNKARVELQRTHLDSVSKRFRQGTFYFLVTPVILTVLMPETAAIMWANFEQIPHWFRVLFVSVYSAIWGLPIIKSNIAEMFAGIGRAVDKRRQFKIRELDDKAFFDAVRPMFQGGRMSEEHVKILQEALKLREKPLYDD